MRSPVFAALVLSASLAMTASAQVKSVAAANPQVSSTTTATEHSSVYATRARVLKQTPPVNSTAETPAGLTQQAQTETSFNNHPNLSRLRRTEPVAAISDSAKKTAAKVSITAASTQLYRVGPGDVLDIQLSNYPSRNSTLFTVLPDGVLEYPLVGNPIVVGGMTTVEIATLLQQRIKIFRSEE